MDWLTAVPELAREPVVAPGRSSRSPVRLPWSSASHSYRKRAGPPPPRRLPRQPKSTRSRRPCSPCTCDATRHCRTAADRSADLQSEGLTCSNLLVRYRWTNNAGPCDEVPRNPTRCLLVAPNGDRHQAKGQNFRRPRPRAADRRRYCEGKARRAGHTGTTAEGSGRRTRRIADSPQQRAGPYGIAVLPDLHGPAEGAT
jgi:hypothetical protein